MNVIRKGMSILHGGIKSCKCDQLTKQKYHFEPYGPSKVAKNQLIYDMVLGMGKCLSVLRMFIEHQCVFVIEHMIWLQVWCEKEKSGHIVHIDNYSNCRAHALSFNHMSGGSGSGLLTLRLRERALSVWPFGSTVKTTTTCSVIILIMN